MVGVSVGGLLWGSGPSLKTPDCCLVMGGGGGKWWVTCVDVLLMVVVMWKIVG